MAEAAKQEESPQKKEKNVVDLVMKQINFMIETGAIKVPKDFSHENAVKAAYIVLQDVKGKRVKVDNNTWSDGISALDCSITSIANTLLKMIVWGLSPMKQQCSFIVRGKELTLSIEYAGNIALAKRYGNMKDIKPIAVFEDDEFDVAVDLERSVRVVTRHETKLENFGKPIKAAYAKVFLNDGSTFTEVMNIDQIKKAWSQGSNYKLEAPSSDGVHAKFDDQMGMKTVVSRACKLLIRGSNDSVLFDENDDEDPVKRDVDATIRDNSGKTVMDFTPFEEQKPQALPEKQANPLDQLGKQKLEAERVPVSTAKEKEKPKAREAKLPTIPKPEESHEVNEDLRVENDADMPSFMNFDDE